MKTHRPLQLQIHTTITQRVINRPQRTFHTYTSTHVESLTRSLTFLTLPSDPGKTSTTLGSFHRFQGARSSWSGTVSFILAFHLFFFHLFLCCKFKGYSLFHLTQSNLPEIKLIFPKLTRWRCNNCRFHC